MAFLAMDIGLLETAVNAGERARGPLKAETRGSIPVRSARKSAEARNLSPWPAPLRRLDHLTFAVETRRVAARIPATPYRILIRQNQHGGSNGEEGKESGEEDQAPEEEVEFQEPCLLSGPWRKPGPFLIQAAGFFSGPRYDLLALFFCLPWGLPPARPPLHRKARQAHRRPAVAARSWALRR